MRIRWRSIAVLMNDAWPPALASGGLVAAALVVSMGTVASVQWAGMLLQLAGLATVARGLSQMRRLFGRPSLAARTAAWFRGLYYTLGLGAARTATLNATMGEMVTVGAEARVVHTVPADAPIERRVAALENKFNQLRAELDHKVQDLRSRAATLKEQAELETRTREAGDQHVASRLEEVAVGGLHLETVGLLWLAVGVICTSIPDAVARWVQRLM